MSEKARLHRPVVEGDCLVCHGPHASKEKGLLKGTTLEVCGACHADTIRRQELSPTEARARAQGRLHRLPRPALVATRRSRS